MGLPCGVFPRTYIEDTLIFRTRLQRGLILVFLALLLLLPLLLSDQILHFLNVLAVTIIAMVGLQVLTGLAGQISLGHVGFIAIGGYMSAFMVSELGVPFLIALLAAGIISGLSGIIIGTSALRVKGFYLALVTLGAHLIIVFVFSHVDVFGGPNGIPAPAPVLGDMTLRGASKMYYVIIPITVIAVALGKNLSRSRMGRAFVALRDNDIAAEISGVNVFRYKIMAFFVSCFFAGIAGSLWAHYTTWIAPEHFQLRDSIWYVGFLIVGGQGSMVGAIFAAAFWRILEQLTLWGFPILTSSLASFLPAGYLPARVSAFITFLFGLIIAIFILLEPKGLAYRWERIKSYYRLFPFARRG